MSENLRIKPMHFAQMLNLPIRRYPVTPFDVTPFSVPTFAITAAESIPLAKRFRRK